MFLKNFSYLTFLCSFFTAFVKAELQLPSFLKPCSKSSPDFNKCMIENEEALIPYIINGNSSLNIPNMNPMQIPKIAVKQGNRQIGLNMEVTDVKIYGMGSVKTIELDLNMDKKHLKSRNIIPRLEIIGNHKSTGNIMVVKIYGQGKFNITAEEEKRQHENINMDIHTFAEWLTKDENLHEQMTYQAIIHPKIELFVVDVDCSYNNTFDYETKEDGYSYAITKNQKLKLNSAKRVYFNLENMLGDEKLDTAVNDLLNQYWKELSFDLFQEVTEDLLDIMKIVVNVILGVFPANSIVKD